MKKTTLFTKTLLTLSFLLISLLGFSQSPQTFNSTGTFTVPAGVTQVTVEAWGAGGRGGARSGSAGGSGGGGGGAYSRKVITVTPSSTYTVTVGSGSTTNAPGGDSWFNTSGTILAKGGNSVDLNIPTAAFGGASASCIGTVVYSGGNGKDGVGGSYGGGGGSSAGTSSVGNNATNATGAVSPSGGGNGGNGRSSSGGPGIAGNSNGGGGGGSFTTGTGTQTGGSGGDGQVIITWTAPVTYCAPTYTNGPGSVDQITNVTLGTLSNTSGPSSSPFYTFYNAVTIPNINTSSTAAVSITFGSDANQYAAVWIDFNQDNIFQSGEGFISSNAGSNGSAIINIPIPTGATLGNTRMRVRGGDDYALNTSQACGASNSTYGETEDYIVNIVAPAIPTITSFGASSGCVGGSITINGTNLSSATVVKIGGTDVTSITSTSATQIVAVIASGTTGTVSVTTAGGSATSVATFIVNPPPTVNAGSALSSICKGGVSAALGGSFGGSATSATWTTSSGGTFTNNSGSTPNSATWTPTAGFTGTATLVLTTAGGSCGTTNTSKTQIVNGPTADAGSALGNICKGGTTATLGGSYGGTATAAIWTSDVPGGTFANNTGTTPNTTTWTPPAAYTGTATLTLTTSGGSCGTTTASKTQVVNTGSFATVGSAMTISGTLTSTSLGGNPTSGNWTKISGPTGTVTFSNATSGSSTATVPSIGTYVFRWTISSSCGTSSADITVTYLDANYHRDYTLFYEDFDATDGGWTNTISTNGSWVRTDAFPVTVAEIGENSFWRLSNFDDYKNNTVAEITSPIYNFTGYENLLFNIDVRYNTELNQDGMRILYSINNGAFVQLGASGSGINWYNSSSVAALGSNGWSDDNATATLAFTPVGIGPNRFLRATTALADATFRNQSNVRFKVEFKSGVSTTDNGVAFDNVAVEGNAIVALANSPIAPAKINQNLRLWFKSNAGISVTDGNALTAWDDQAFDISRADLVNKESVKAIPANAPTYRDNASRNINFNPVVDFNAANKNYMNGKGGLYSEDYFVVVYPDDLVENSMGVNGRQIPLGGKSDEQSFHEDPTGLGLGNTTARYSSDEVIAHNVGAYVPGSGAPTPGVDSYGRSFSSPSVTYNEPIIINVKTNASGTETEIYKNGIKIDNLTGRTGTTGTGALLNFYEYKNLPFYLGTGRSGISGRPLSALNGRLSEVVVYTEPNSDLNQQKIQSYLGLKYGITLHAIGSSNVSGVSDTSRLNDVNYIDSAGATIWDTSANIGFNYDITGIGRDDDSQLYQKQSKTVNSVNDIAIGLSTLEATNNLNTNTCNNKNFLIWGNNNGTLAAQPAIVVDMSTGVTPPISGGTNVSFISVGRTWKVVETGAVPITKISIPTSMLSATITPPGDYLMFISSTPTFDPTAEYRVMKANGSNLETSYDFNGTKYITFGYAPEKTFERCVKFNGTTDYMDAGNVLDLNTSFTVSAWINRTSASASILSKRNSSFTQGYDLYINGAGRAEMSWYVGASKKTITSAAVIPTGIWHHVGVTFDGATAKIFVDGINKISANLAGIPTATSNSFLIAAADGVTPVSFFNGSIDEVRVWKVALTDAQFRYVMNQEILNNSTFTNGAIVPNSITANEIKAVAWSNLSAYYPMSTYTYTNAKDISLNNYTAALRNLKTVDRQTAPLPYLSDSNGSWETKTTWLNNAVQDLPNSTSIEDGSKTVDWNIVKTSHNISSTGNKTVLGLFVNSNTLTATTILGLPTDGSKIEVSHYLKLDGKIDLQGLSQLVQTTNSDLDVTSAGSIEKDQQGQVNKFNYNYWSSPVSPINNTANNTNYTVDGVMKDGLNATPRNISWISGYNGIAGSTLTPVSLARYWLYKFDNKGDAYANWEQIQETAPLAVGKGYTLKGSGGTNIFTFVGKPNNGTISNPITANNLFLVGNPYPSALDANQFINDNILSVDRPGGTDGTLYFWEHDSNNISHVLTNYLGGYAAYNLVGGLPAVAPSGIGGIGTGAKKTPKQYIPVGQGFFIYGTTTGGNVVFNNGQRIFAKETDATSTTLFRTKAPATNAKVANQDDQTAAIENYKKIRLGYNTNNGYHRQVLLGFMDEKATSGIDYGYDGEILDDFPNDMFLLNGDVQLTIEGEGYFDSNASYPIGVKSDVEGKVSFTIDALENFDSQQKIYLYDDEAKTYNEIQNNSYVVTLPVGSSDTRFSLRFIDKSASAEKTLGVEENTIANDIKILFAQDSHMLKINNNLVDTSVEKVTLYNINGQAIATWKIENQNQQNIQIPVNSISSGVYIAKLKTTTGELSKKIIIH